MYSDKKRTLSPVAVIGLILVIAILAAAIWQLNPGGSGFDEEAAASVKDATLRCALQCYVVEGAYPPDLKYLQENYGLAVNTRDYYITYDSFASNLAPDVRVEPKKPSGTKGSRGGQ